MNKYLGSYLTELEIADRNKTDDEMGIIRNPLIGDGIPQIRPRFDRNKFKFNKIMLIANQGIVKNPTEEQLRKLQETLELLSKLDQIYKND